MQKEYKVIVFDLGNTLIKFDHNISANKIANLFRLDPREIYGPFFDSDITRSFEAGKISVIEFYKRITARLHIKIPYKDFMSIWNDIFWEDEGSCAIARKLKKHYKLFLLSNINRSHFEYIHAKFDIIKIFDELVLSFLVGAIKPDRIIFDDVVRRAGGEREKIVYVDDREDLVKEAMSLGIDSIRYEGADKLERSLTKRGILV